MVRSKSRERWLELTISDLENELNKVTQDKEWYRDSLELTLLSYNHLSSSVNELKETLEKFLLEDRSKRSLELDNLVLCILAHFKEE